MKYLKLLFAIPYYAVVFILSIPVLLFLVAVFLWNRKYSFNI